MDASVEQLKRRRRGFYRKRDRKSERAVCAYERKREERARERVSVSARVCVKKEAESVNAELTDFLPSTNSSFRSYYTAKRRRGNRIR